MTRAADRAPAADVRFFKTPAELRRWFAKHHASEDFLWVGFYKKDTGEPSVTWPESVDEALVVGWIDGIRKRLDKDSYVIRFTPRRPRSIWSAINIARVAVLTAEKRMRPAGAKAFAARLPNKSGIYSYEQRPQRLPAPYAGMVGKYPQAAAFLEAQPPSYQKLVAWWIVSAKREETRMARVRKLIEACSKGKRL